MPALARARPPALPMPPTPTRAPLTDLSCVLPTCKHPDPDRIRVWTAHSLGWSWTTELSIVMTTSLAVQSACDGALLPLAPAAVATGAAAGAADLRPAAAAVPAPARGDHLHDTPSRATEPSVGSGRGALH
jgi:hypothetical protein